MLEFVLPFLVAAVILLFAGTVVHAKDFRLYRKVFDKLPTKQFYLWNPTFPCSQITSTDEEIIWFSDGSILLKSNPTAYIFPGPLAWMSPYTWYWERKYTKWFKENLIKGQNFRVFERNEIMDLIRWKQEVNARLT